MAGTDYNRVASRAVRQARDESGMSQAEFAAAVSDAMGLRTRSRRLKQSTLSGWELGTRQVPASALFAAASAAGVPVGLLVAAAAEGVSVQRALGRDDSEGLARRLAAVEAALKDGAAASPVARAAAEDARRDVRRRGPR